MVDRWSLTQMVVVLLLQMVVSGIDDDRPANQSILMDGLLNGWMMVALLPTGGGRGEKVSWCRWWLSGRAGGL